MLRVLLIVQICIVMPIFVATSDVVARAINCTENEECEKFLFLDTVNHTFCDAVKKTCTCITENHKAIPCFVEVSELNVLLILQQNKTAYCRVHIFLMKSVASVRVWRFPTQFVTMKRKLVNAWTIFMQAITI